MVLISKILILSKKHKSTVVLEDKPLPEIMRRKISQTSVTCIFARNDIRSHHILNYRYKFLE